MGDFVKYDAGMLLPPPKNPFDLSGDLYDSCVDDVSNPKLFVTFERCQAYPEYLIEY